MSRIMPAGEFKAKCLEAMDEVASTGEPIIVTKRGRPVAQIVPITQRPKSLRGFLRGSTEYAIKVLGVKLVMVLGHSDCGAVKSAIALANGTASYPPDKYGAIGEAINPIDPPIHGPPANGPDARSQHLLDGHDAGGRVGLPRTDRQAAAGAEADGAGPGPLRH